MLARDSLKLSMLFDNPGNDLIGDGLGITVHHHGFSESGIGAQQISMTVDLYGNLKAVDVGTASPFSF